MRKLQIEDAEVMRIAIQQEIGRSEESRYDHRLHGLLLVTAGQSCREVAELFGENGTTVQRWVNRFEQGGEEVDRQKLGIAVFGSEVVGALDGFLRFYGEFIPTDGHGGLLSSIYNFAKFTGQFGNRGTEGCSREDFKLLNLTGIRCKKLTGSSNFCRLPPI